MTDPDQPEALPLLKIDEPTLSMQFMVNTFSPLAGTEGKFVTSRQIRDRLHKELLTNMALRVHDTPNGDVFDVAGRGELHLGILLEKHASRRLRSWLLAVRVSSREIINGVECEPYEHADRRRRGRHQGGVAESTRHAPARCSTWCRTVRSRPYRIPHPGRGLIGFRASS